MRKKSTRFLSAALAACMMLSALPVGAFAADPGTASTESSVSAQATETLPFEGKEITTGGTYTMPSGTYTGNFVINTDEDVKIEITGDVTYEYSPKKNYLFHVTKVGTLTVDGSTYKIRVNTTTADGAILTVGSSKHVIFEGGHYEQDNADAMFVLGGTGIADLNNVEAVGPTNVVWNTLWSKMTVNINGGKYVGTSKYPTLMCSGGTTYINDVEAHNTCSDGGTAICVKYDAATTEIKGGKYTATANVINQSGGVCRVYGGQYKTTSSYIVVTNSSSISETTTAVLDIHGGTFEGAGAVIATAGKGITTIDETAGKTVIRSIEGGDGSVVKAGVRSDGESQTTIISCTIEDAENGIWLRNGTPSVTVKNVEFNNNANDICLNTNQKITIADTFTDRATVKVADDPINVPRQITTSADGQDKLNLISNDVDTDGKTYVVAYDADNHYRYLAQRTGYTVTTVNATAETAAGPLNKLDQIAKDTEVTLTADAAPEGKQFAGWKFEKVTSAGLEEVSVPVEEDTENPGIGTFKMPDYDIFVTAEYEDEIIDPGTGDGDYGGDIAAGVVIGGIAVVGAYEVGTGLYRITQMDDVVMPANRLALAKLLWERAGKPEPETITDENLYSDMDAEDTDAQKAARWAVEQELLKEDDSVEGELKFHPAFPVSKLRVCLTWEKAKQKGLFDQNTEA